MAKNIDDLLANAAFEFFQEEIRFDVLMNIGEFSSNPPIRVTDFSCREIRFAVLI